MTGNYWKRKIIAFLHDPPDKAIQLIGHEKRREELLAILGLKFEQQDAAVQADHISATMQRFSHFPEGLIIDFSQKVKPVFKHTLSGKDCDLDDIGDMIKTYGREKLFLGREKFFTIIENRNDWNERYLSIWRKLPEIYNIGNFLPADTRIPDHSIFDHMDITAALAPCVESGAVLFSFKLGPVQEFITNARKTVDLWAGSHILSYLSFKGILAIVEDLGPDAIIFPYLRGQPFVDWWLSQKGLIEKPQIEKLAISNIPHRFLCIVPRDRADTLTREVHDAVMNAWRELANKAKEQLGIHSDKLFEETWNRQIENAFHVTTHFISLPPLKDDPKFVKDWFNDVRNILPEDIRAKYERALEVHPSPNAGVLYGLYYELLGMLIDQKSRFFEYSEEPSTKDGKCTICGIRNPLRVENKSAKDFWLELHMVHPGKFKEGERLCAVCTVKRLYVEINPFRVKCAMESVATIAMKKFKKLFEREQKATAYKEFEDLFMEKIGKKINISEIPDDEWLYADSYTSKKIKDEFGIELSHKDLSEIKESLKKLGKPPKYYAILCMDGDNMGKRLSGEISKPHKYFLHPVVVEKIEDEKILDAPRLLNPNIHISISRALLEFSVNVVGKKVEKHHGLLIYSGGDDVLALLPADEALKAGKEINDAFRTDFYKLEDGRKVMLLGEGATMSAGIVFAHYKYPLYDAIARAKEACEIAKDTYGRSAFVLVDIRHSGQITMAGGKWEIVDEILDFVGLIGNKEGDVSVSRRFPYKLLEESDVVNAVDIDGKRAFLKFLLRRHVDADERIRKQEIEKLCDKLIEIVKKYECAYNCQMRGGHASYINSVREIGYILKIIYTAQQGGGDEE